MLPTLSASLSLTVLAVFVSVVGSAKPKDPVAPGKPKQGSSPVGHASWTLGLQLYKALRKEPSPTNTIFSPLLLTGSLRALSGGAGGSTAGQLQELLKPTAEKENLREALTDALKSIREANGTSFSLLSSSALFSKHPPGLDQNFLKAAQAQYGLDHVPLGSGDRQASRETIHRWAKAGMRGVETEQLKEELSDQSGALILANALHFKGLWDRAFDEENQDPRTFLGNKYTKVPMMHRAGVYLHYEDVENMVQVLELGLWGGKASVLLLLPFHVENLSRLDGLLSPALVTKWLGRMSEMSVAVSLPRVNVTSALSLQKQLAALGLKDAWDQKTADFSGVSGGQGRGKLHLGGVFHWASLELSSATGRPDGQDDDEHVENSKLFYADHPFIILVKDNSTGALLLMGALDQTNGPALHDEL
ncbi:serine (or cysteine) peptidase inhibitor, clade H, member 2 [Chanos chanos]|uniref:Serine (Or cysteine) peptidase inhibitor, clade H, member 2 n=1 Tax=Chanos chanos TaxID=29144 RepID=A0A6J2VY35_CHACN|nr:serpin H1-like [Chanos chanos]